MFTLIKVLAPLWTDDYDLNEKQTLELFLNLILAYA